jgi:integrase
MPKTPSYRLRSGYDQAIVTLTDAATKKRRDYWLGPYGTPESRERYHRLIAEWESLGRRLPDPIETAPAGADAAALDGPTVGEVILQYWRWAGANVSPRDRETYRPVFRLLRRMDGSTPASAYGPRRLRLLREAMVTGDEDANPPRKPWSRPYTNNQVKRVRRLFKWAASHELVPPSVHQALATVEPLRRGRTRAREPKRVTPVAVEFVEAVKPHMSRQVRAVVDLQLLTGARPGELLRLRPADIEMDGDVWRYRLDDHKTAHAGRERTIYLGPRAQEVIRPFLAGRPLRSPLFSPAEAEAERRAAAHAARRTPMSCGNRPGTNRVDAPRKQAGDAFTPASYARAIDAACQKAFPLPAPLGRADGETVSRWKARLTPEDQRRIARWRREHRFHPYQLRHTAATLIRKEFGLEAAQLALGHASAAITDAVYAERDESRVVEVMRAVG